MIVTIAIAACDQTPRADRIAGARDDIERALERCEAPERADDPASQYYAQNCRRGLAILDAMSNDEELPATPFHVVFRQRRLTPHRVPERHVNILSLESDDKIAGFYLRFADNLTYDFPLPKPKGELASDEVRYTILRDRFVFLIEQDKEKREDFPDLARGGGLEAVMISSELMDRIYSGEWLSVGLLLEDGSRSKPMKAKYFPEVDSQQFGDGSSSLRSESKLQ